MRFSSRWFTRRTTALGVVIAMVAVPAVILSGFSAELKKATILHSELVLPPAEKQVYEACLFPLAGGRLALFHDLRGVLRMRVSEDRGRTWGEPTPLRTVEGKEILG